METVTAPPDMLHRFLAADGTFRILIALHSGVAADAARRHGLTGLAAVGLGRTLGAATLLATLTKGRERVTLQLVGDGPLGGILCDAWSEGTARGYVTHAVSLAAAAARRPQVRAVLGRHGHVSVFRDLGLKDLYHGQTELTHGEVDEDVENYLRHSEQVPSALGCDVLLDAAGEVQRAVSVLVQGMPGTREQEGDPVREAQHALRTGWLWRAIAAGALDPAAMATELAAGHGIEALATTPLAFHCPCTEDRVARALKTVPRADLERMLAEDGGAEVTCHFCARVYRLDAERLGALIGTAPPLTH